MTTVPVITIDGPSGVGKGTLCKAITTILQWNILDSGVIYRLLARTALTYHIDITSEEALMPLVAHLNINYMYNDVNKDMIWRRNNLIDEICTEEIAKVASQVAVFPRIREALLYIQRTFRKLPGLIAEGRDMGTVVFPDAQVKIFLDASLEERAYRRMLQLQKRGFNVSLNHVLFEIKDRDIRDSNRAVASLIPAKDALILDSTDLTIKQLIEKVLQYIYQKLVFV